MAIDVRVAAIARGTSQKVPGRALAQAARRRPLGDSHSVKIPVLETTDPDLLRLNSREGTPLVTIREPLFEGPFRMAGL